jgi:metal-sulfur cluster biosynthetic enzyme
MPENGVADRVRERLRTVMEPELHRDLITLDMVKDLRVEGGTAHMRVVLTTPACPLKDRIKRDIEAAVVGNAMAGLVTGVQYVAMLVAGLFGGVIFDRWRPDHAMIGSRTWSAIFCLLPVIGFYIPGVGISITLLIVSSVGLASLRMVFSPALQSTIPTLVRDRDGQQAINGLFDATYRIARLVGPMVAALLHLFLPVIHFLSATALGFIVSGASLRAARQRLIRATRRIR